MEDQDKCITTEEELISLLHLGDRRRLNQLKKHWSFESLFDYVYRDLTPEEAFNVTDDDESEIEENC